MNIRHLRALQVTSLLTRPHQHGALTRRQFLKAGATAAALAVGSGLVHPQTVRAEEDHKSARDPRPIPYGTPFLSPSTRRFSMSRRLATHCQTRPSTPTRPPTIPSTITDFNGFVGLAYVGGQGTHHDLVTDQTASLYWEVDMRSWSASMSARMVAAATAPSASSDWTCLTSLVKSMTSTPASPPTGGSGRWRWTQTASRCIPAVGAPSFRRGTCLCRTITTLSTR